MRAKQREQELNSHYREEKKRKKQVEEAKFNMYMTKRSQVVSVQ